MQTFWNNKEKKKNTTEIKEMKLKIIIKALQKEFRVRANIVKKTFTK